MKLDTIHNCDCLEGLAQLRANSLDSVVCDPPYHLTQVSRKGSPRINDPATPFGRTKLGSAGFMGKTWDGGDIAFRVETWQAVYRAMKPGAFLVAFGGTRTYHRMACAIEDAGFEVRDSLMWIYGSGFPKSANVSKMLDRKAGAKRKVVAQIRTKGGGTEHINRVNASQEFRPHAYQKGENVLDITAPATDAAKQWDGWGSALKPAHEPIVLARKPLIGTIADNVLQFGTGGLNVDGCRISPGSAVPSGGGFIGGAGNRNAGWNRAAHNNGKPTATHDQGRWPANVIFDEFAGACLDEMTGTTQYARHHTKRSAATGEAVYGLGHSGNPGVTIGYGDKGGASRFFYCAKSPKRERDGSTHPTVKPLSLMRYLVRLVAPPGGLVCDPFSGSGSTAIACIEEGFHYIGFEKEKQYWRESQQRIKHHLASLANAA